MKYGSEFVKMVYSLPKTQQAVTDFLNSAYVEELPGGKKRERMMWERFEGAYVKVTRKYNKDSDDNAAAVYLYAHKLVSRCVLAEVAPYFESDGQLFSYYQLMVRNTRINDSIKERKNAFVLIGDMLGDECAGDGDEQANFEECVLGSDLKMNSFESFLEVLDLIDGLEEVDGVTKDELVMVGRLFVDNGFSFDNLHGLCGLGLQRFRLVKRKFIEAMKGCFRNG